MKCQDHFYEMWLMSVDIFSSPNLISPLTKKTPTQAYKLFWVHINIPHIWLKYSPCYWAPTNTLYTSPINYLESSHKYYPLYPIWVLHKKYLPRYYQIGPQKYTISTKKPNKALSIACCYTAPLKARCCMASLKLIATRHL